MRQAFRQLIRDRGLTTLVALTIALGVGVNTALFSLVNCLHRPLPVRNSARLYVLATRRQVASGSEGMEYRFTYPALADFRAQAGSWSDLLAFQFGQGGISDGRRARQFFFSYVSGNYFSALGVAPAGGRLFSPGEGESPDAPLELVLSYSYWQKLYGGDASVIGRQVRLNGAAATVIGVAARGFSGTYANAEMDGFVPLSLLAHTEPFAGGFFHGRTSPRLTVMGILRPGVPIAHARTEAELIAARLERQYPDTDKGISVWIGPEPWARPVPIPSMVSSGPFVSALFLLLGGMVLLLACMNVGNVLLVRAAAREREMAVRAALGSGRWRLIRQVLTESLLLASCGGVAGVLLGSWAAAAIGAVPISTDLPAALDLTFDWRVFAYALGATLLAGTGAGLWPAFAASRADVAAVLHESGRAGTAARGSRRLRNALVVVQVAGSLTLLIVAGLFAHGLSSMRGMDIGFDPRHMATLATDTTYAGYDTARATAFYRDLERRVRELPGVDSAALSFSAPVSYKRVADNVEVEGSAPAPARDWPLIFFTSATPDYFRALAMPVVRGRPFRDSDGETAPRVAIVNQTMARSLWPGQEPLGKRFRMSRGGNSWYQIVGVAHDSKYLTLFEPPLPFFYVAAAQHFDAHRTLQVRGAMAPETLLPRIEAEVRALDPDMPITESRSMEQALDGMSGFWGFRLGAWLSGAMGAVGLVLAVVGVYGVVSYTAGARTREIGVRMALGAGSSDILRLVLGQGVALIAIGIGVGLALAGLLARAMTRGLHGAIGSSPLPFLLVTVFLAAVALLASYIPARRVLQQDPARALRHE